MGLEGTKPEFLNGQRFGQQRGQTVWKLNVRQKDLMIFQNIAHESRLKLDIPREISKQAVLRTIKKFRTEFSHSLTT